MRYGGGVGMPCAQCNPSRGIDEAPEIATCDEKDRAAYTALEAKMIDAAKKHDFGEYDRLSTEQLKLGRFRPWVQHSFEENAKPVVFHAQMLADFNTVDEVAQKMLEELARAP
jgi:hypothetical protein